MLSIPDTVAVPCPRCADDIHLAVDVTYSAGIGGNRVTAEVTDYAGPFEQHYRDAGHVTVEDNVSVRVHTVSMN